MKPVALKVENFKKVKLFEVEFDEDDNMVLLTGKNKQGKSTILDAIVAALCGGREVPDEPIRMGEDEAISTIETEEFNITRVMTKSNKTGKLKVTDKEGNRVNSPQSLLNSMLTKIGLRPRKFAESSKDKQVEMLTNVVNFKFDEEEVEDIVDNEFDIPDEDNPIDLIEELEEKVVLQRRDVNRDLKKKKNTLESYQDVEKVEEVDVPDLVQEKEKLQEENDKIKEIKDTINKQTDEIIEINEEIEELKEKIRKLKDKRKKTEKKRDNNTDKLRNKKETYNKNKERIEEINEEIKEANKTNKKFQRYQEKQKYKKEKNQLQEESDKHTDMIESLRDMKDEVMKESEFPINNLAYKDEEVYYNGVPFEEASDTEKLEVGFSIMKANNPDLKIVLIDNGRTIDEENMEFIEQLARDDDYLVLMEYMDESEQVGIVLEEGEIKKNNYEENDEIDEFLNSIE